MNGFPTELITDIFDWLKINWIHLYSNSCGMTMIVCSLVGIFTLLILGALFNIYLQYYTLPSVFCRLITLSA